MATHSLIFMLCLKHFEAMIAFIVQSCVKTVLSHILDLCDLQVLSHFSLTHEEIVARRMLLWNNFDRAVSWQAYYYYCYCYCKFSYIYEMELENLF